MRDDEFLSDSPAGYLQLHQRLATNGARAAHLFELDGARWLAVPQLAQDLPGQPANMNGGNSNIDAILFRWEHGCFVERERLPCPGGEDALTFTCDGTTHLAFASLRTGEGPYEVNSVSRIFRHTAGGWQEAAAIPSFAAKQWHHFVIEGRQFLALAQGLTLPHYSPAGERRSLVFERVAGTWQPFQVFDGEWGYNWHTFEIAGRRFLAYADHVSASLVCGWDGTRFVPFQTFAASGGRAFRHFARDGEDWLAFAAINGDSLLYRWDGGEFRLHQTLGGPGGREFALIPADEALYLARICFIEGTPAAPRTDLKSQLFRWTGKSFELVEEFPTYGGTDAAHFRDGAAHYLVVANSLTPDIRFRQDMAVYRINL